MYICIYIYAYIYICIYVCVYIYAYKHCKPDLSPVLHAWYGERLVRSPVSRPLVLLRWMPGRTTSIWWACRWRRWKQALRSTWDGDRKMDGHLPIHFWVVKLVSFLSIKMLSKDWIILVLSLPLKSLRHVWICWVVLPNGNLGCDEEIPRCSDWRIPLMIPQSTQFWVERKLAKENTCPCCEEDSVNYI